MALPMRLIDILAKQTVAENMRCPECAGSGEVPVHDDVTGHDAISCEACLGSGYSQLGLILEGILKPPPEGFGPVDLKQALADYLDSLRKTTGTEGAPEKSVRVEQARKQLASLLAYESALSDPRPVETSDTGAQRVLTPGSEAAPPAHVLPFP